MLLICKGGYLGTAKAEMRTVHLAISGQKGGESVYPLPLSSKINLVLKDLNFYNSSLVFYVFDWPDQNYIWHIQLKNSIYLDSTMRRTHPHHRHVVHHRWPVMCGMNQRSQHLKTPAKHLLYFMCSKYKWSKLWPSNQYLKKFIS